MTHIAGCKRDKTTDGCKLGTGQREFVHACSAWLKVKNKYCLNRHHGKKDHK